MTDTWTPADHGSDNRNLRQRAARGATWTLVDNWGRQLLQLLVFAVLARLLVPEDFGLVALAMVFVMLAALFVDQGMGDAIVQRRVLTPEHVDTAFWAALALGGALTVAGLVLAIPIAALLGQPQLQPVLQALSLTPILTALAAIPIGILRREMRFRSLAVRTLISLVAGGAAGIAVALIDRSVWALVTQQLVTALVSVVTLWTASPWRPRLRFSRQHFRELFGFGANIVGADLLHYVMRYSDNFLIGTVLGVVPLGIYAIAYRILDAGNAVLLGVARKVAFPAFARVQNDADRIRSGYFRVTRVTSALVMPAFVGASLVAPELIRLVFGGKWDAAGPVAAVLFLVGPALALQGFCGSLLVAVGRPDVALRLRLLSTITAVIGFAIAVWFGIVAVALAFVARAYLILPLQLIAQRRYAGIPSGAYLQRLLTSVIATAVMAAFVLLVKWLLVPRVDYLVLLLAEVATGLVVYLLAIILIERALLRDLADFGRQALGRGERS